MSYRYEHFHRKLLAADLAFLAGQLCLPPGRRGSGSVRALWSNDETTIREGLEAVAEGRTPDSPERLNRVKPMTRGLGCQYETLDAAGEVAKRDVLREVPPMYAMARLAALLGPLPLLARGVVAQGVFMAPMAVAGGVAIKRRRDARRGRAARVVKGINRARRWP
jgi:hypothetical protein